MQQPVSSASMTAGYRGHCIVTFTGWMLLNGFSSKWLQATTVYQCLHSMAPVYLAELCLPITASASRRGGLRSATTSNLVIPCCKLTTYSTRAFSVAGPVCWNSLPDYLKSSDLSFNCFRQQLRSFLPRDASAERVYEIACRLSIWLMLYVSKWLCHAQQKI